MALDWVKICLSILCAAVVAQACNQKGGKMGKNDAIDLATTQRTVREDVVGLERLINVPKGSNSVRWERRATPGGSSLAAVMSVGPSELEVLLEPARRMPIQAPTTLDFVSARLLFPSKTSMDLSGKGLELRGTSIDPAYFVDKKKSGLLNGMAIVLADEKMVFVSLYEM